MRKQICEPPRVDFCERNRKIKDNLLKVYVATLTICVIFVAIKGFI